MVYSLLVARYFLFFGDYFLSVACLFLLFTLYFFLIACNFPLVDRSLFFSFLNTVSSCSVRLL